MSANVKYFVMGGSIMAVIGIITAGLVWVATSPSAPAPAAAHSLAAPAVVPSLAAPVAQQPSATEATISDEQAQANSAQGCKDTVSNHLLAPGSAQWSQISAVQQGYTYEITGVVDSQNGFGALLRTNFECKTVFYNDGTTETDSLKLDGQPVLP